MKRSNSKGSRPIACHHPATAPSPPLSPTTSSEDFPTFLGLLWAPRLFAGDRFGPRSLNCIQKRMQRRERHSSPLHLKRVCHQASAGSWECRKHASPQNHARPHRHFQLQPETAAFSIAAGNGCTSLSPAWIPASEMELPGSFPLPDVQGGVPYQGSSFVRTARRKSACVAPIQLSLSPTFSTSITIQKQPAPPPHPAHLARTYNLHPPLQGYLTREKHGPYNRPMPRDLW